jgi:hypothetical protein
MVGDSRAGQLLSEIKETGQRQKQAQPSKNLKSHAPTLNQLDIPAINHLTGSSSPLHLVED